MERTNDMNVLNQSVKLAFLAMAIVLSSAVSCSGARTVSQEHLDSQKRVIQTITTEYGDVVDCYLIHKQPAFDHPSLKNHKIQMRPTVHPVEAGSKKSATTFHQQTVGCPDGTVPILRTNVLGSLAAPGMRNFGKTNTAISAYSTDGHESAVLVSRGAANEFYGTRAQMSVWDIHVEPDEFSASKIAIISGDTPDASSIQAGWIVHPTLFKDSRPRIYGYWTADGFEKTGCFNILCAGFVQVSQQIYLGAIVNPLSLYGGEQKEIAIQVNKDSASEHWWLLFGSTTVGYWPTSIFNNLKAASIIEWGGEVLNKGNGGHHTQTQMGNGHFPSEGWGKSSFFRNILVADSLLRGLRPNVSGIAVQRPECYNLVYEGRTLDQDPGYAFYYGGPGYGPKCL